MKKEMLELINENNLSPFNRNKTPVKTREESIFKTKDAKAVYNKVVSKISGNFFFPDTSNLFLCFPFTNDIEVIKQRQRFFEGVRGKKETSFLTELRMPKVVWRAKYGVVVVTEDEKMFNELQKLGCPVKFLISEYDVESLEDYDVVQVLECENFSRALEGLPQAVFLDSLDDVYLERYVELLSSWQHNLEILNGKEIDGESQKIIEELVGLFDLFEDGSSLSITKEGVEKALGEINNEIYSEVKKLTLSGEYLIAMLSKNALPSEFQSIFHSAVKRTGLPSNLFEMKIPSVIDEEELDKILKKQNAKEHTGVSSKIIKRADELRKVPGKIKELSDRIVVYDFISGISNFIDSGDLFPGHSEELLFELSQNRLLDNAKPISFHLNDNYRCSILTGANSGGKTTLLEHILQLISLFQLGLPVNGRVKMPLFSEVYYFAKNKGSANKGAFETLLTQMSDIKPGRQTLILADEIESVTEPGVAGVIVAASAEYFINKGCFLIIATHLGKEIQKKLPIRARIDGIEAKGLDENYELIVDHNPILGRLANSTPELIVEKMANSYKTDYFNYLYDSLKKER